MSAVSTSHSQEAACVTDFVMIKISFLQGLKWRTVHPPSIRPSSRTSSPAPPGRAAPAAAPASPHTCRASTSIHAASMSAVVPELPGCLRRLSWRSGLELKADNEKVDACFLRCKQLSCQRGAPRLLCKTVKFPHTQASHCFRLTRLFKLKAHFQPR